MVDSETWTCLTILCEIVHLLSIDSVILQTLTNVWHCLANIMSHPTGSPLAKTAKHCAVPLRDWWIDANLDKPPSQRPTQASTQKQTWLIQRERSKLLQEFCKKYSRPRWIWVYLAFAYSSCTKSSAETSPQILAKLRNLSLNSRKEISLWRTYSNMMGCKIQEFSCLSMGKCSM